MIEGFAGFECLFLARGFDDVFLQREHKIKARGC